MPAEDLDRDYLREGSQKSVEHEPQNEDNRLIIPFTVLQTDLEQNYTEHLRHIEESSLNILGEVVHSAKAGFYVSLVLNILIFVLGAGVIVTGLVILVRAPEDFGKVIGVVFSLLGVLLVTALLFWKGPLDRILQSVSNLARINVITIGLAHSINQIARVFVQESLKGDMNLDSLDRLNQMVKDTVHSSVEELQFVYPKESAEEQAQKFIMNLGRPTSKADDTTNSKFNTQEK